MIKIEIYYNSLLFGHIKNQISINNSQPFNNYNNQFNILQIHIEKHNK